MRERENVRRKATIHYVRLSFVIGLNNRLQQALQKCVKDKQTFEKRNLVLLGCVKINFKG